MKRLLLVSAAAVLPFSMAPSYAQCLPAGAPAGSVVTCSDDVDSGFANNNANLDITVNSGVIVSSDGGDVFRIRGTGTKLTNNGTIDSNSDNDGIDGRAGLTVINNGAITSEGRAVNTRGFDGVHITNVLTGTMVSVDKAIRIDDEDGVGGNNNTVINHGFIESETSEGIEAGNDAIIENSGTIKGFDDAIQVAERATILNSGLIESTGTEFNGGLDNPQDAIDLDSGDITNTETGVIKSTLDAAIDFDGSTITSTIINRGLITGKYGILVEKGDKPEEDGTFPTPNTASQIVENHGQIVGTSGLAMDLGAGDDVLSLFGGSSLVGTVDMGEGNDRLNLFDDLSGNIADGAVLDGGAGIDLVDFRNLTIANVIRAWANTKVLSLIVNTPDSSFRVALSNWEDFQFGDDVCLTGTGQAGTTSRSGGQPPLLRDIREQTMVRHSGCRERLDMQSPEQQSCAPLAGSAARLAASRVWRDRQTDRSVSRALREDVSSFRSIP